MEDKIVYLLDKVHIHLDYDIDVKDHKVHYMVMQNNRDARKTMRFKFERLLSYHMMMR